MKEPIVLVLSKFNREHKKMNGIYHNYAKQVGLSDAAFWILYSLYEHGHPCTQKELCEEWFYPPQTINTALKALEEKEFVTLELVPKSRKNKQVFFTEAGKVLVEEKVSLLVQAEERAFALLNEQEREQLLAITQKHIALLENEIEKII